MFDFRIINTQDKNQIIDRSLKTPYNSLTPVQMVEYTEMDKQLLYMDRIERKHQQKKIKWFNRILFIIKPFFGKEY